MFGLCGISYHLQHERACFGKPRDGALAFGGRAQLHETPNVHATPEKTQRAEKSRSPSRNDRQECGIASRQLVLIDVLTSGVPVDTLRAPLLHAWERSMSMCRPGCRAGAHPHITRLDQTKNAHAVN